jgi:hypothetical protein
MVHALKDSPPKAPTPVDLAKLIYDADRLRVRCPLCHWRPSAESLSYCQSEDTPEPPFNACGTAWNTFLTRGKCPGCGHQWKWTSCLRCHEASLHEDWYESDARR